MCIVKYACSCFLVYRLYHKITPKLPYTNMADSTIASFNAEIKKVSAHKSLSTDITYSVMFQTDDPTLLTLGALPGDTIVYVEVSRERI